MSVINSWFGGSIAAALFASFLTAQDRGDGEPAARNVLLDGSVWSTPIRTDHNEKRDEAQTWASGPDYKVSFHDGFRFYPVLGPAYPENLPWHWRTIEVRLGERVVTAPADQPRGRAVGDWRYEYDLGGAIEAYDVSPRGVEQTFVLSARPRGFGDLIVRGAVATALSADARQPIHGPLRFQDAAGNAILEYGAAFAIDARSRRFEMRTGFANGEIRLILDAASVAQAEFPLVVDPLIGSRTIQPSPASSFGAVEGLRVSSQTVSAVHTKLVTWSRQVSAGDWDAFGVVTDSDFAAPELVFRHLTAETVRHVRPAFCSDEHRWVIAYQRDVVTRQPFGYSSITVYLHDVASTSANSGRFLVMTPPLGQSYRNPVVGGTKSGSNGESAILVFQRDFTATNQNTFFTQVSAGIVDVRRATLGAIFDVANTASFTFDRESPHVNRVSRGGTHSWLVAWQQIDRKAANPLWDVYGRLVDVSGPASAPQKLLPAGARNRVRPKVAGNGGYVVTYVESDDPTTGRGDRIAARRFNWTPAIVRPTTKRSPVTLADSGRAPHGLTTVDIAFDTETRSHWAMTYKGGAGRDTGVTLLRLGYSAGVVETQVIGSPSELGGGVDFDRVADRFAVVSNTFGGQSDISGVFLEHGDAGFSHYGTGCGQGAIASNEPYAGFDDYTVYLNVPVGASGHLAILGIGAQKTTIPLDAMGMPGCVLNTQPFVTIPTQISSHATASVDLDLPDNPVFIGDIRFQWIYEHPLAGNHAGLLATRGLLVRIRP